MRLREQELGNKNIIGTKIAQERKKKNIKQKDLLALLQLQGVDISSSALSKIEGQLRLVTDIELVALAKSLRVSADYLLGLKKKELKELEKNQVKYIN